MRSNAGRKFRSSLRSIHLVLLDTAGQLGLGRWDARPAWDAFDAKPLSQEHWTATPLSDQLSQDICQTWEKGNRSLVTGFHLPIEVGPVANE